MGGPDGTEPQRWILVHPVNGPLAPALSLQAGGVVDGETLYLRPDTDGSGAPYAEDTAEEAAAQADASPGTWTAQTNQTASAALLAGWLGMLGPLLLWRFGTTSGVAIALGVVALVAAVVAVAAHRMSREPLTVGLFVALVSLFGHLVAAGIGAAGLQAPVSACGGALAAGVAAALACWLAPACRALFAGFAAAATIVLVWAGTVTAGLPVDRAAAVTGLLGLAAVTALPRLATSATGLGRLADAVHGGDPVHRTTVRDAAQRARLTLVALLVGITVPAAAAAAVVTSRPDVWAHLFGGTLGVALWLRSRIFSHVAHKLAVAVPGVIALVAVTVSVLRQAGTPMMVIPVAVAGAVALFVVTVAVPGDIIRIRIRTLLDRVDLIVLIACGPLLLGVFNAYSWATQLGGG